MKEIERFEKLKEMGYVYNPETGNVEKNGKIFFDKRKDGYKRLTIGRSRVYQHRYIWWLMFNEEPNIIDHIDHNRENNRLENLRNVTHNENNQNRKKIKGFYFHKRSETFQVVISVNGKKIYLGNYKTSQEAQEAYLEAKKKYHKI
jgi:hypothetical protein